MCRWQSGESLFYRPGTRPSMIAAPADPTPARRLAGHPGARPAGQTRDASPESAGRSGVLRFPGYSAATEVGSSVTSPGAGVRVSRSSCSMTASPGKAVPAGISLPMITFSFRPRR